MHSRPRFRLMLMMATISLAALPLFGQEPEKKPKPDDPRTQFEAALRRMPAQKAALMQAARAHLVERYDLTGHSAGVRMTGGKPVQDGVRVKLPAGVTWQQLAAMAPEDIRRRNLWPLGFMPLPHPNHPE